MIGSPYNLHAVIAPIGISSQGGQYFSIHDPPLDNTIDDFTPQVTYVTLSGTLEANQQRGGTFHVSSSLISLCHTACCAFIDRIL